MSKQKRTATTERPTISEQIADTLSWREVPTTHSDAGLNAVEAAPVVDAAPMADAAPVAAPTNTLPAATATARTITGIPMNGTIHLTGVTYPFKGKRLAIFDACTEGIGVAEFCKVARVVGQGGVEDVRIYARKGIAVVMLGGVQAYPPKA